MEYLLKSSIVLVFFYVFYLVFLQKETFFNTIRIFFIVGILASIILPNIYVPVYVEQIISQSIDAKIAIPKSISLAENIPSIPKNVDTNFNWISLFSYVYYIGFFVVFLKLVVEFFSLVQLIKKGNKQKSNRIIFVEIRKEISPFSIFNYLVYNAKMFSKKELNKIIAHEKIHINQKHTYDLLLLNILTMVLWFNPFVWLYKKKLQENLEFIADKYTVNKYNKKEYQYLLLKTSITKYPFALSNNFYQSLIKKRIIMLQKTNSKKVNQLKYVLIIPFMALFLFAFNTKEVFIQKTLNTTGFVNPVALDNVIGISNYGFRINPITKERKFHKGIDIQVHKDMDVYATANGIVAKTGFDTDKGNFIEIQHADNFVTKYQHLNFIEIDKGDSVKSGDIIGTIGNSGKSTSPHLHYEILKNGKNINPISFINYFFKKEFKITAKSTNTQLKRIETAFNHEKSPAKIKFSNIRRGRNDEIIGMDFLVKFPSENKFYKRFTQNGDKPIKNMTLSFVENEKEFTVKSNKTIATISKKFINLEDNNSTEYGGYNTVITAKTTDAQLQEIANDFRTKNKIGFKIISVERNKQHEIMRLKLSAKTKKSMIKFDYNSDSEPIPAIFLLYNSDEDMVTFEKVKDFKVVNEQKNGSINYKNETYFYTIENDSCTFYNKFGEKVNFKLAEILQKKVGETK